MVCVYPLNLSGFFMLKGSASANKCVCEAIKPRAGDHVKGEKLFSFGVFLSLEIKS